MNLANEVESRSQLLRHPLLQAMLAALVSGSWIYLLATLLPFKILVVFLLAASVLAMGTIFTPLLVKSRKKKRKASITAFTGILILWAISEYLLFNSNSDLRLACAILAGFFLSIPLAHTFLEELSERRKPTIVFEPAVEDTEALVYTTSEAEDPDLRELGRALEGWALAINRRLSRRGSSSNSVLQTHRETWDSSVSWDSVRKEIQTGLSSIAASISSGTEDRLEKLLIHRRLERRLLRLRRREVVLPDQNLAKVESVLRRVGGRIIMADGRPVIVIGDASKPVAAKPILRGPVVRILDRRTWPRGSTEGN